MRLIPSSSSGFEGRLSACSAPCLVLKLKRARCGASYSSPTYNGYARCGWWLIGSSHANGSEMNVFQWKKVDSWLGSARRSIPLSVEVFNKRGSIALTVGRDTTPHSTTLASAKQSSPTPSCVVPFSARVRSPQFPEMTRLHSTSSSHCEFELHPQNGITFVVTHRILGCNALLLNSAWCLCSSGAATGSSSQ